MLEGEGAVHMGARPGDVAPRILTVGSHARAELLSHFLEDTVRLASGRGFLVFTGSYRSRRCSVIAMGMGAPMMDLMIHEATSLMPEEPMALVRVGTCAILDDVVTAGDVMVAALGSLHTYRDYASVMPGQAAPFALAGPEPCHDGLTTLLIKHLERGGMPIRCGVNVSGHSFFDGQGKPSPHFDDCNDLRGHLVEAGGMGIEMETHQLFFQANRRRAPTFAAACHVGIASKLDAEVLSARCLAAGKAALEALADFEL